MIRIKSFRDGKSAMFNGSEHWLSCDEYINAAQILKVLKYEGVTDIDVVMGKETKVIKGKRNLLWQKAPDRTTTVDVCERKTINTYCIEVYFAVSSGGGHNGHSAYSKGPEIMKVRYMFKAKKARNNKFDEIINSH